MKRLVVLAERLPYGRNVYRRGEEFEASDKDARLLKFIRKAADAVAPPPPAKVKAIVQEVPAEPPVPLSSHYLRRDMRAEDGRTGETTSLRLSRRGRPRKVRTSED